MSALLWRWRLAEAGLMEHIADAAILVLMMLPNYLRLRSPLIPFFYLERPVTHCSHDDGF